jgi:hypothetical protein
MTQTSRLLRSPNENDIRPFDATTAHVLMPDGSAVRVNLESLEDFRRRDITARWSTYCNGSGRSYVAVNLPAGGSTTVSRLIAKCGPNEAVTYANGNRMDLRRSNLVVLPRGPGRRKALEAHASMLFPNDPNARADWLDAYTARQEVASARRSRTQTRPTQLAA